MTDRDTTKQPENHEDDLRGQLLKRLAVAGVLVAVLLGVLAFFDHLSNSAVDDDTPVFTQAVPVQPKKEVSQPVKPAEDLPPPPGSAENAAVAEKPADGKGQEAKTEVPPAPSVEATPPVAEHAPAKAAEPARLTPRADRPGAARQATVAAPAPLAAPARQSAPVPEESAPPVTATRETAPTARVIQTQPAATQQPAPVPQPVISRLLSGFVVQAGVFTSAKSAEELHAKLTLNGVPSTLETRVQVGPFKTRQEAESAQQKLKALGIDSILVPPPKGH